MLRFDRYAPRLKATHDELRRQHTDMTAYSYWTSLSAMIRRGVDPDDSPAVERYARSLTAMNLCRLRAALRVWVRDEQGEIPPHWRWITMRARSPDRAKAPGTTVTGAGTTDDLSAFTEALIEAGAAPHGALGYSRDVGAVLRACAREGVTPDQVVRSRSPSYGYRLSCAWRAWTRWRASHGMTTLPISVDTRSSPKGSFRKTGPSRPTAARTQTPPAVAQERPGKASEGVPPGLHTSEASRALLGYLTSRLGWPLARCIGLRWSDCVITTDRTGEIRTLSAPRTGTPADWSSSGTLARKLTPLSDGHWRHVLWAHRAWTAPPHEDAPLFPRSPRSTEPLTEEQARLVLEGSIPLDPWGVDDFLAELAGGAVPEGAEAPTRAPKALPDYDDPIGMRPRMDDGRAHEITGAMFLAALDDLVEATREK